MRTFKNFKHLFKNEANEACKDDGKICYSFDGEDITGEISEKKTLDSKKIKNGKTCAYGQCCGTYGCKDEEDDEWGNGYSDRYQQQKDRSINQKRRELRKSKKSFQDTMFGWSPKQDSYDEY